MPVVAPAQNEYLKEKLRKIINRSYHAEEFVNSSINMGDTTMSIHRQACVYEELLELEVQLKSALQHLEQSLPDNIVEIYSRGK